MSGKLFATQCSISWQKLMPLGDGGLPKRGEKDGHPLKKGYFTAIGWSGVKMVADRHRRAAYYNKYWRRAS